MPNRYRSDSKMMVCRSARITPTPIIICCSFSVVRIRNQFNAYFLSVSNEIEQRKQQWCGLDTTDQMNGMNELERANETHRGCKNKQYLLIPTIVKLLQSFVFFPKTTIKRFLWLLQRVDLFFHLFLFCLGQLHRHVGLSLSSGSSFISAFWFMLLLH